MSKQIARSIKKCYTDTMLKCENIPAWEIRKQNMYRYDGKYVTIVFRKFETMLTFLQEFNKFPEEDYKLKLEKLCELGSLIESFSSEIPEKNFVRGVIKGLNFYIAHNKIIQVSVGVNTNFEIWRWNGEKEEDRAVGKEK
jgi:hypothetical protein